MRGAGIVDSVDSPEPTVVAPGATGRGPGPEDGAGNPDRRTMARFFDE
jgi:hypothetical protein